MTHNLEHLTKLSATIAEDGDAAQLPQAAVSSVPVSVPKRTYSDGPSITSSMDETEKGSSVCEKKGPDVDPFLVTWDGPDDPANPMVDKRRF
jgi:hypothetical protein